MSASKYDKYLKAARRIIADAAKPELQKLLWTLYGNPPSETSLREDDVVAVSLMEALQVWWARQVKLSMDPSPIKRPTPTVVRVINTGYEEDALLRDWGSLLHRAKAVLGKENVVYFSMSDYFASRWSISRTNHAIIEETKTAVRICQAKQKWVKQKASKEAWTPDGGMRLVPYLRGKPL